MEVMHFLNFNLFYGLGTMLHFVRRYRNGFRSCRQQMKSSKTGWLSRTFGSTWKPCLLAET